MLNLVELLTDTICLLRLLLLSPVSAASVAKSHSAVRRVKTDKRANIGQHRMVASLMLFVPKDITVGYEKLGD